MGKYLLAALLFCSNAMAQTLQCDNLFGWRSFKQHFISTDGRVIDPATENAYSTSEGQSYALFFALLANDHKAFAKILNWTQNNLARGDLQARLPAWQWGKQKSGQWGVIDANSAADSDLWIAYSLLEAGRLWQSDYYTQVGKAMAKRIIDKETAVIPGLGLTLLPGSKGFHPSKKHWRLNPSYLPIFIFRGIFKHNQDDRYRQLIHSAQKVILQSAPKGIAPDWADYYADEGFDHHNQVGSFDAIRVYLWAAMMAPNDPLRAAQLEQFKPMAELLKRTGEPPQRVDILKIKATDSGPMGFSAALLPFLRAFKDFDGSEKQWLRLLNAYTNQGERVYYDEVLAIFAINWMQGYYYFTTDGIVAKQCD